MAAGSIKCLVLIALSLYLLAIGLVAHVEGHASLEVPRARNVVFPPNGVAWERANGNGLGAPPFPSPPHGNSGPCGDPFQEYTTNYVATPTGTQATYTAGSEIQTTVWMRNAHGGRISFRICPRNTNLDFACFEGNNLISVETGSPDWWITSGGGNTYYTTTWRLPAGITCPNGCVLQMEYATANSCIDRRCPASQCGPYASGQNPITTMSPGFCDQFPAGWATANQEKFWNCADIAITSGGSPSASPSPVPSSPPAGTPSPTVASPAPSRSPSPSPSPSPKLPSPSPTPLPSPSPPPVASSPPPAGGLTCAGKVDGQLYPHPSDCTKYLVCSNANLSIMNCPAGLHFSAAQQICDWPASAGCTASGR